MVRWSLSDLTVQRQFQKFHSGDTSLEDEKDGGWACNLDNEQLQAIVEQNP